MVLIPQVARSLSENLFFLPHSVQGFGVVGLRPFHRLGPFLSIPHYCPSLPFFQMPPGAAEKSQILVQ